MPTVRYGGGTCNAVGLFLLQKPENITRTHGIMTLQNTRTSKIKPGGLWQEAESGSFRQIIIHTCSPINRDASLETGLLHIFTRASNKECSRYIFFCRTCLSFAREQIRFQQNQAAIGHINNQLKLVIPETLDGIKQRRNQMVLESFLR
ncbi:hypothetical protein AMECASPLE_036050 [Ameca splendens]|uniref:Uncharacterized protein n=1 Tax=Ameca splendens TaxID=208324 RepID=A0ABV1A3Z7_9TELE